MPVHPGETKTFRRYTTLGAIYNADTNPLGMAMTGASSLHSTIAAQGQARALPLLTLLLTDRCNSRCVSCDYWRTGARDLDIESVARLLPELAALRTRLVLFSGGEPLLNPQWQLIAQLLRSRDLRLWLLTSGLSLAKYVNAVAALFESITVSLDGASAASYQAIRGLNAFDTVCRGIELAAPQVHTTIRVTVQRGNYRELPSLVDLARRLGVAQISFLAADVSSTDAFGRGTVASRAIALQPDDLVAFELVLNDLVSRHAKDFDTGFIAESPQKLQRLLQYYRALSGHGDFPPVRCNAPEFSAVMEADGHVRPCFFIAGTSPATLSLQAALESPPMGRLRAAIAAGGRSECRTCVCSMWCQPERFAAPDFLRDRLTTDAA
jgi:MoaA/NifB/PqqE/SkfB family radical SAM enzyme